MTFSLHQRIFIVKYYYQSGNSTKSVQNEFPNEFSKCVIPSGEDILQYVKFFEEFGNVCVESDKQLRKVVVPKKSELKTEILWSGNDITDLATVKDESFNFEDPLDNKEKQSKNDKLEENDDTGDNANIDDYKMHVKDENSESNDDDDNDDDFEPKLNDDKLPRPGNPKVGKFEQKCEQCEKVFRRKRKYLNHLEWHKKICEICGKRYLNKESHMQQHSGELTFQCSTCGTLFNSAHRLRKHMVVHSEERPFPCDICDKSFKSKEHLRGHRKRHSEAKYFKCNQCGKAFKSRCDLKKHTKTHDGIKPFICNYCGKSYATTHSLSGHICTSTQW